ncbi:DUF6907 domain-containing protein [Streptomyces sp. CFMR 7]|uniref:DUF6907 domain-containing protein n=1 Tax=Streptomyces sp. CFMR 7 TaxID=1649184 RepID=UPI00119D3D60|nr:hypothetical protein [Streptomyces sp. CFMR 7]
MNTTQTCTVYPWCAETGNHTMHASTYAETPTPDGYGDRVLPANVMAEDGAPYIGWLDLDLTPAQTRERVTELHRHLDTVAALADLVDGQAPLEPGAECYSATAAGARGALINSEIYRLDDPKPGEPAARLAVFGQPEADADLDVAGADQLVTNLEQYLPRLRAQRNHLAAILGADGGGTRLVHPQTHGGSIRGADERVSAAADTPEHSGTPSSRHCEEGREGTAVDWHSTPVVPATKGTHWVRTPGDTVSPADGNLGHYPWCNTAACITHRYEERDGGGSYVEHVGRETTATLTDGGYPEDAITITAGLGNDESYTNGTQVYVNVGGLNALAFDSAGVDQLLGQLDTLTIALRTMRAQMDSEVRP